MGQWHMGPSICSVQQQYNTTAAAKVDVTTQWYDDTQIQLLTCQKQAIIAYFTDKTTLFCGYFEGFTRQFSVTFHNFTSCSDTQKCLKGKYLEEYLVLNMKTENGKVERIEN